MKIIEKAKEFASMKRPLPAVKNQTVKVYRNLNNKCLSVMESRLVIGHAQSVELEEVTFKVSQAGRERCLREKRKNVHAFVVGQLLAASLTEFPQQEGGIMISYNPYKSGSFCRKDTNDAVESAEFVIVTSQGIIGWGVQYCSIFDPHLKGD